MTVQTPNLDNTGGRLKKRIALQLTTRIKQCSMLSSGEYLRGVSIGETIHQPGEDRLPEIIGEAHNMTARKPNKRDPNQLDVPAYGEDSFEKVNAVAMLRPTVQAGITIQQYDKNIIPELDLMELIGALSTETRKATDGDLSRADTMLTSQAHALDAIFNSLARRAAQAGGIDQLDAFLKLALRAQSQCRSTWEAISAIQNPPVVYAKQANIAQLQQVNNEVPRAGEKEIPQNELLEDQHGERLDTTTAGTAIEADPAMAALEEVHRSEKS